MSEIGRFPHTHEWELEHLFFWLLKNDVAAATYHLALNSAITEQQGNLYLDFDKESYEGFHVLTAVWGE